MACTLLFTHITIVANSNTLCRGTTMSSTGINMLDLKNPSIKTLHFAWMAFFITFVMWFGLGPLAAFIKAEFALTEPQWKALLMLNVAITIPSRILIGILVDKFGPRPNFWMVFLISVVWLIF